MLFIYLRSIFALLPLGLVAIDAISMPVAGLASGLLAASLALDWHAAQPGNNATNFVEIVSVLEGLALTVLLVGVHLIGTLGVLAAIPIVLRTFPTSQSAFSVSAAASVFVFFGAWSQAKGWLPDGMETLQAVGVLLLGYGVHRVRTGRVNKVVVAPTGNFLESTEEGPIQMPDESRIFEMRESYRKIRDAYQDLERRSEQDRLGMALLEWRLSEDHSPRALAHVLREAVTLEGVSIYVIPDAKEGMVLAGSSGSAPAEARSLKISVQNAATVIRDAADRALRAHRGPDQKDFINVVLSDRGRLMGLATIFDDEPQRLEEGRRILEGVAPIIARSLRDDKERDGLQVRAWQAELLAELASRPSGESAAEVCQGVCAELMAALKLNGCEVIDLTGLKPKQIGGNGETVLPLLNLGDTPGIDGWLRSGALEILVPDAREDARCERASALRRGVGTISVMPLISSGTLVGAISSWMAEPHGLPASSLGALRSLIPHLLRRAFGGFASARPGLVDTDTFWNGSQGPGSFVEIDLGSASRVSDEKELQRSRKKLLTAAMSRLPQGGLMTRRDTGTLMGFLAGFDERSAQRWVEGLRPMCDPSKGMEVRLLAKSQQTSQFSESLTA